MLAHVRIRPEEKNAVIPNPCFGEFSGLTLSRESGNRLNWRSRWTGHIVDRNELRNGLAHVACRSLDLRRWLLFEPLQSRTLSGILARLKMRGGHRHEYTTRMMWPLNTIAAVHIAGHGASSQIPDAEGKQFNPPRQRA